MKIKSFSVKYNNGKYDVYINDERDVFCVVDNSERVKAIIDILELRIRKPVKNNKCQSCRLPLVDKSRSCSNCGQGLLWEE